MKTVVITGSSKGIGAAIARVFYDHAYFVVINGRTDNGYAEELGSNAIFVEGDVRELNTHLRLAKTSIKETGRLNTYINCAGISIWKPIDQVDEEFWNLIVNVNLTGTFWGCKTAAGHLREGGSIINISSLAGKRGSANNSVYCASKFGVNGITQSLAKELGPRGIRINAVCPVYIETESILENLQNSNSPTMGKDTRKYLDEFAKTQSALKRLPKADEVAEICLFLASNKASAITGQCINVDCGVLPQ